MYFAGIFICVHLEAKKLDLKGISRQEIPKLGHLMKKIYLLLPLVMLVVWVSGNYMTMQKAATCAIFLSILVSLFHKENRITPHKFWDALAAGGKSTITVGAACGMAGIIAGTITMTGLANELINGIVSVAGNRLIIALVLTMLCCIVLGMGVPTTANYCIMAATTAPILIRMGVPALAAHFFVFYFGIVADITPPVALAAYAGSAIAKGKPMQTNPLQVAQIIVTSFVGVFGVAAAMEGYCFAEMSVIIRIVIAVGGLLLIHPALATDAVGLVCVAACIVYQMSIGGRLRKGRNE